MSWEWLLLCNDDVSFKLNTDIINKAKPATLTWSGIAMSLNVFFIFFNSYDSLHHIKTTNLGWTMLSSGKE